MLRAHYCVRCGDPMPLGRRVDRKYCRASCRTSAYRSRRAQTAPHKGVRRAKKQETSEPLPPALALALRQIPPAILTTLAAWFGEHASSEQLNAARQRITELEQQVQRVRAEQTSQQEAHRRDKERQQGDESAQRMREQKVREVESRQRIEASSRQLIELQSAVRHLEAQVAERTVELEHERAEHGGTRHFATQQNIELGRHLRQAQEASQNARAEADGLRSQLSASQEWSKNLAMMLAAAEQQVRERWQEHSQALSPAKRTPKAPRRGAQPKRQPRPAAPAIATPSRRPPPPEPASYYVSDDPLLMLMKEYVILRDDLARQSISLEGTTQCLPDRTAATIEAHAVGLANKKRHEFVSSADRKSTFPATWIDFGHMLDEASEAMLQAEIRLKIKKLRKKLGHSF